MTRRPFTIPAEEYEALLRLVAVGDLLEHPEIWRLRGKEALANAMQNLRVQAPSLAERMGI